ncbi:hypothetical protein [Enterobacter hormaechei]|uniref:hypothetical protein n=1 Tax=Enterobacter hormaechei TaxID=158836 RepID=UPI0034E24308
MATIPTSIHPLFTVSFNHKTDCTELADNCERFSEALVECHDPVQKMALCGRLCACLALLQPTLMEPVPEFLKESLTVDEIPLHVPAFEVEADQVGHYCQVLTQLIVSGSLTVEAERVISDLLYELVGYYAETLKAPRWLRTKEGSIELLD